MPQKKPTKGKTLPIRTNRLKVYAIFKRFSDVKQWEYWDGDWKTQAEAERYLETYYYDDAYISRGTFKVGEINYKILPLKKKV